MDNINNSINTCSKAVKNINNTYTFKDNDAGTILKGEAKKSQEVVYGIPTQLGLLMESITKFYENKEYIDQMISIIDQKNILSLRILDWFITNYSKKHKTIIANSRNNLDVYQMYKLHLKSLGKNRLDPFCRKNKLIFYYDESKYIETSCGQLCFFKWCFENNIFDYVRDNLKTIEDDMKISLKEKKKNIKKDAFGKTNRQRLSINSSKRLSKYNVKYTVDFD